MYLKILIFFLFLPKLYSAQVCNTQDLIDITDGVVLPNKDIQFDGKTYTDQEYVTDETGSIKACKRPDKPRIRKCCPIGTGYDFDNRTCVNLTEPFDPQVIDNNYAEIPNVSVFRMFDFEFGKRNCTSDEWQIPVFQTEQQIQQNGQLCLKTPKSLKMCDIYDKYCIDVFTLTDDTTGNKITKLASFICYERKKQSNVLLELKTTAICMLISCVFILATVVVYCWLPELWNLRGRVLVSYLLCLFFDFIFLSTMKLLMVNGQMNENLCVLFTFGIYFAVLSAFCWLSVMSYNVWRTFSGVGGLWVNMDRRTINAHFRLYAQYAFSIPFALTIIVASLEFSGLPEHELLPNITPKPNGFCFFDGKSKYIYLYAPMIILCSANMIFFVLTVIKINREKKEIAGVQVQQDRNRERLRVYVKIFVLMGLHWILEFILPNLDTNFYVMLSIDALNMLTGLIIFIMFVCTPRTFRLLKKRYRQLRGDSISRTETATSRLTSSRAEHVTINSRDSNRSMQ